MHKRWYDVDPTVSLAVSLIRNTNDKTQLKCADFIIDFAQKNNRNSGKGKFLHV